MVSAAVATPARHTVHAAGADLRAGPGAVHMVSGDPLPARADAAYPGREKPVSEETRMDTLLQVVVSIGMYVLIFFVIGVVFYAVDKRVKGFLRRR